MTLIALRRFAEAAKGYAMLDRLVPGNAQSLNGLATAAMHACDWTLRQEFSGKNCRCHPGRAPRNSTRHRPGLSRRSRPAVGLREESDEGPVLAAALDHKPFSAEKIKLAYCSADFNSHVTSRLMAGLFEMHDRKRFEVIGISFGLDDASPMRGRVVKAFDQFHDVRSKSERGIAALIAGLGRGHRD